MFVNDAAIANNDRCPVLPAKQKILQFKNAFKSGLVDTVFLQMVIIWSQNLPTAAFFRFWNILSGVQ